MHSATAQAHPNIALIKYWGNRDDALRLPSNGSISMNLEELWTLTRVTWLDKSTAKGDSLNLNGSPVAGKALLRVSGFLDLVRRAAKIDTWAQVVSENNFPSGAGIASSASAFAALALAATHAAGMELEPPALSRLARRGSGSACRSVPSGFVEWKPGVSDQDSFAECIAPPDHWALVDVIAVVSSSHKPTGSTEGHALAGTSPLQEARVADTPRRLSICRQAIQECDFAALASIVEMDSNLMHAVMFSSTPSLFYWQPETLAVMQAVRSARQRGLPACSTVDAGPNVHVICELPSATEVEKMLSEIPGVGTTRLAHVGGGVKLVGVELSP